MVLRTIVVFSILFNVYIDDTTLNIVTFCTWRFFFFLVWFFGSQKIRRCKTGPPEWRGPPAPDYNPQCKSLWSTWMDAQTLDNHPSLRSLSPLTALLRGLCLFIFFSITPLLDDNWSHFFLERDTWQQLVARQQLVAQHFRVEQSKSSIPPSIPIFVLVCVVCFSVLFALVCVISLNAIFRSTWLQHENYCSVRF